MALDTFVFIAYNALCKKANQQKESYNMKKKLISVLTVMSLSMVILAGCSFSAGQKDQNAESTDAPEQTELANPWTESDEQGVAEATGFDMVAPDGAANVSYSYMADGAMAQMTYELDGAKWTYRMQMADALTDISGMAYQWTGEEKGSVAGKEAMYYAYSASDDGAENDVQVVNWYDAVPGVTYSLSASAKDLEGMDIQAYAEKLYAPLQGDATGDPDADRVSELNDYFLGEHKRSYDESVLTIAENEDGTFAVNLSITRLCVLENGVGTFEDHKMTFEVDDPSENKLSGVIYRDSDNSLAVKITDSTWDLLPNDEVLDGFGK